MEDFEVDGENYNPIYAKQLDILDLAERNDIRPIAVGYDESQVLREVPPLIPSKTTPPITAHMDTDNEKKQIKKKSDKEENKKLFALTPKDKGYFEYGKLKKKTF